MDQFIAPIKADYKAAAPGVIDGILSALKDEKLRTEIKTAMLLTPDYVRLVRWKVSLTFRYIPTTRSKFQF
jgi:hypothetical protein